ncbi:MULTISPECIES: helix-turn-helix transcriptional regulator [Streptomyces]|uniref:helix-turn-helix transcriptional regulator n=1 Tax=Streptomyces TaxID=1883 RepID=UPI0033A2AA02
MPITSETQKIPTLAEIEGTWPPHTNVPDAALVLGCSTSQAYAMIKRHEFPAKVIRFGKGRVVVVTASLVRVLRGEPDPQPPAPSALVAA